MVYHLHRPLLASAGGLKIAAFLYGGFAATWVFALNGNAALAGLYTKWFGQDFTNDFGAGLSAPIMEEFGKGTGVLLLMFIALG